MKVCELMRKGIVSCYGEDTVKDVARMLDQNHLRSVVVVQERGEVWGIITYREMLQCYGKDLTSIKAQDIMRPYRIAVDPQWEIEEAIEVMRKLRYYHLIIIDPHVSTKWPVGMLSSFDIVRYMARLEHGSHEYFLKINSDTDGYDSHG